MMIFDHELLIFSVCSNIPGHKTAVHVFTNVDSQKLIDEMARPHLLHQAISSKIMRQKFDYVFQRLQSYLDTFMEKYP